MKVKLAGRGASLVLAALLAVVGAWQYMGVTAAPADVAALREQWWHWLVLLAWLYVGWRLIVAVSGIGGAGLLSRGLPAVIFGLMCLYAWEVVIAGLRVPVVLLPAPTRIAAVFASSLDILWGDFVQTVVKSVLPGYAMGCGASLGLAALVWRYPALGRGLLPLGNFMSVMPIVGLAPIMVMFFGFDWQSKAAMVVLIVFFPMLVNAIAGFESASRMERDLMRTYAASKLVYFRKLVLPSALPFIFNGLKLCFTLALIGAIVAEFFGTPIVGIGFRISSEIGRMGLEVVWASIVVSALVGTSVYGMLSLLERTLTFWHPSWRGSGG